MGLFDSLGRFVSNLFGLAAGNLDRASDALASGSPGAIKAQFRHSKEELRKQYNQMRDAISQIMVLREQKKDEMEKLQSEEDDLLLKMDGALASAEKEPENTKHQEAYERFFSRKNEIDSRQEQLDKDIEQSEAQLTEFKEKLTDFQKEIKKLDQEEAETIADIISSQKVIELNDRITSLSHDNISQSLTAIREKRSKLKAQAKLVKELSHEDLDTKDEQYKQKGQTSTASEAFAIALAARKKQEKTKSKSSAREL